MYLHPSYLSDSFPLPPLNLLHLPPLVTLFVLCSLLPPPPPPSILFPSHFSSFPFPLHPWFYTISSYLKFPQLIFHSSHCLSLLSSFPLFPFIPCILLANTPQHLFPPLTQFCPVQSGHTLAVINIGAPAGGMSTAVRAFVRFSLYQGHTVLGIRDGINGLFDDKVMNTRYSFDPQMTDANRGGSIFSLLNWI